MSLRPLLSLLALCTLSACAAPRRGAAPAIVPPDLHVPPFASVPFEPFTRNAAIAIALREWRLWGQKVDDEPPEGRPPPAPEDKPERWEGLWQRVGEYWWLGQDAGVPEAAWTGVHDAHGVVFPASDDGNYAWSAAFVSYVMRIAGAGPHFPYAISHSTYIDAARAGGYALQALPPETYAPLPGDLICMGRGGAATLRFVSLPAGHFPAHCDIVVEAAPGVLSVIGGNVDDSVTMKHVPVTETGRLAQPDGTVVDTRYPWFVVLRVLYAR